MWIESINGWINSKNVSEICEFHDRSTDSYKVLARIMPDNNSDDVRNPMLACVPSGCRILCENVNDDGAYNVMRMIVKAIADAKNDALNSIIASEGGYLDSDWLCIDCADIDEAVGEGNRYSDEELAVRRATFYKHVNDAYENMTGNA